MFAQRLKRLAVTHPRLSLTTLFVLTLLLLGADPVAAGDVSAFGGSGGALVGLGP